MSEAVKKFLREAIELAAEGVRSRKGGPFGAVVVKDGRVIGRGCNRVTSAQDPTAHAEVVAIRAACEAVKCFHLSGCEIYCSCEPCPMCLGAIFWARIERVYFACGREDAARYGFDDAVLYEQVAVDWSSRKIDSMQLLREEGLSPFVDWAALDERVDY